MFNTKNKTRLMLVPTQYIYTIHYRVVLIFYIIFYRVLNDKIRRTTLQQ